MSDCIESHLVPHKNGYCFLQIGSRRDGTRRKRPHHRVVYAEHHDLDVDGPEMAGMEVDHTCFNTRCINIDHLELVPKEENIRRAHAAGRVTYLPNNKHNAKLTPCAVRWIRSHVQSGRDQKEVAAMYGVSEMTVSLLVRRKTWADV
jgi:HNH endonuclease